MVQDIQSRVEMLAHHPFAGKALRGGLRQIVIGNYVLRYRVFATETVIVRLFHGKEDR